MLQMSLLLLGCVCLVAHTAALPVQTSREIENLVRVIANPGPTSPWVITQPVCPSPRGRDAAGHCPPTCTNRFECSPDELCCPNTCGNLSCTPTVRVQITCRDIRCPAQGSVCVERGESANCECLRECPRATNISFLCASDRLTYMTRCHMDKAACHARTTLHEVPCPVLTTPSALRLTTASHSKPIAYYSHQRVVVQVGTNATFRCLVDASPRPTYYWRRKAHRGVLQAGESRHRMTVPQTDGGVLHIQHVRHSDAGSYLCEAANYQGYVVITFNLVVRAGPEVDSRANDGPSYENQCLESPDEQIANCVDSPSNLMYTRIWYYDKLRETCVTKTIRDCRSLMNKYTTQEECERVCRSRCVLSPQIGKCRNFTQRMFYNKYSGRCEPFVYSGCGGNENNFLTARDCQNTCPVPRQAAAAAQCPLCSKNVVMGYCNAAFVFVARIMEVTQSRSGRGFVQLQLVRVVKDGTKIGYKNLNLSRPEQRIVSLRIDIDITCPCPNLTALMHRPVTTGYIITASECNTNGRHVNRHCGEVIISGSYEHGDPIIKQGSLAVVANEKNNGRLNQSKPAVCRFIKQLGALDE